MKPGNDDRYARQRILPEFGEDGQQRLTESTIFIVGCGALGGFQAELLARAGIGRIRLVDRDLVEWSNLQRQVLFDETDAAANVSKAEAAARRLKAVNSAVMVEALASDVTARNAESLLADADLVLDGTDNFETRYLVNDVCVKLGKPWIYGGVIGTVGMAMPILPGFGPCLRCVFPEPPDAGTFPTCDTAGVMNSAVAAVASLQATLALRLLLGSPPADAPLFYTDVWNGSFERLKVQSEKNCPCCGLGNFEYLEAGHTSRATSLCGRNAVQVNPPRPVTLDFASLLKRLERVGRVTPAGMLLRFEADGIEMVIFPDGRAIVAGTTDVTRARNLYARYLGI